MSQKYEKLKTLLKELFQLDQPDLDFGLYRIMHAKSTEVTQFLDKDLLPQVKEAFSLYRDRDPAKHPNADAATQFRKLYSHPGRLSDGTPIDSTFFSPPTSPSRPRFSSPPRGSTGPCTTAISGRRY